MKRLLLSNTRQRGLGLVELMVAITLGVVISGALIQAYLGSKNIFRLQQSIANVQENGRFATNYLVKDIRMAGYIGCPSIDRVPINNLVTTPPDDVAGFGPTQIIRAGPPSAFTTLAPDAVADTDVLVIRKASSTGVRLANVMSSSSASVVVQANPAQIVNEDILLISDCLNADLFRVSGISGTTTFTIEHGTGNTNSNFGKGYGADAEVTPFVSVAYFIRDTGRVTPGKKPIYSLWLRTRDAGQGNAALTSLELVEGVENMKVQFGLDTSGDRMADAYKAPADIAAADWDKVVSVRINLLMQSTDDNIVSDSGLLAQNLSFNGAVVAADGRLRQVFSAVVGIRNRLP